MKPSHIIVIGAGATGLIAARQLLRAGLHITILEARRRIGGRIFTIKNNKFGFPLEGGAEFVHGKQKLTFSLLKEYKLKFNPAKGKVWHIRESDAEKDKAIVTDHHRLLNRRLKSLKRDVPLKKFIEGHFKGEEYSELKKSVYSFVEGYESADATCFSSFTFREDWLEAEKWKQYRVQNGYGDLMDELARDCRQLGCKIKFSSVVKSIRWKKNLVNVVCNNGKCYTAERAIITVPLGVIQKNNIRFYPALTTKQNAFNALGYGDVIKVLILFKSKFWEENISGEKSRKKMKDLFFLFSQAQIPVWWTQSPVDNGLLSGWLSGPDAKKFANASGRTIFLLAIDSLSAIFKADKKVILSRVKAWKVVNWSQDEYALGSYSYATVNADKHLRIAGKPEQNTLFFAGEHFGEPRGTVEAALLSGFKVSEVVKASKKG